MVSLPKHKITVVPHGNMFENFNKSIDLPAAQQRTNGGMTGYRPRSEDFDRAGNRKVPDKPARLEHEGRAPVHLVTRLNG